MLLGCGCNCQEDSVSSANGSAVSVSESSVVFPSQSTWPNSTGYPDPPADRPCLACVGYVRPTAYRVDLGDMPVQPPTIFGDWGACVEMLQPFKVDWLGFGAPPYENATLPISSVNCHYAVEEMPYGPPPSLFDPVDCSKTYPGYFHPNTPGNHRPCAPYPSCAMTLRTTFAPVTLEKSYQVKLLMSFQGFQECVPSPPYHILNVFYATTIRDTQFACLNVIRLQWQTANGNYERQNPDGPGWESYGIGPGNHRSYEFHRGTFPEEITIRPWGT